MIYISFLFVYLSIYLFTVVCGGLADGRNRYPRENDSCDCPEGWEGINCNGNYRIYFNFITYL